MEEAKAERALAIFVMVLMAMMLFVFYKVVTADSSIQGCYLRSEAMYPGEHTVLMGRVEWNEDIRISAFVKYEEAEDAMARYADCRIKP